MAEDATKICALEKALEEMTAERDDLKSNMTVKDAVGIGKSFF